jgi:soluble lytic murein transglycosylase-like protein
MGWRNYLSSRGQSYALNSWLYVWGTGFLILGLLCYALPVIAEPKAKMMTIYKYLDADGVLHLTNKPPKKEEEVLYARSYVIRPYTPPPLPKLARLPPQTSAKASEYAALIDAAALRYNLPPALLHAMIKVESGYNPRATSPKGAVGLMQLMPNTAKRYGVTDRTDPASSIEGGARYMRDLLNLFKQDTSLAVAAYNAGENAVIRNGNTIPPYRETKNYVVQVMALYQTNLLSR